MNRLVIVVALDAESPSVNFLKDIRAEQKPPEGVSQLAYNSWLVEPHKALQFFASLVHNAYARKIPFSVFEIDGEPLALADHQN